jgi:hypothetical protein
MLKQGWLGRQFEKVEKDVQNWPNWMKREAGITDPSSESTKTSTPQTAKNSARDAKQGTSK